MRCPQCGSANVQKSSAFYQQHVRTSKGRTSGFFLTSRGTIGVGSSRRVSTSSSLAADLNAPIAKLPPRILLTIVIGFPFALILGFASSSLFLTLFLVVLVIVATIYLSAPTNEELEREKQWSQQWYCKKCGDRFIESDTDAGALRADASAASGGFVSPVIRATRRNSRAAYADRVLNPVQRAAAMTDRDAAGLNAIRSQAAVDGSFNPEIIGCDLGVISRLSSLNLISYDGTLDQFHLLHLPDRASPHRGWWQRTFG